jgi:hypothetical protein
MRARHVEHVRGRDVWSCHVHVRVLHTHRQAKAEDVLKAPKWPEKYPFSPSDFKRTDESADTQFYEQPRLVLHIGERCCGCMVSAPPAAVQGWQASLHRTGDSCAVLMLLYSCNYNMCSHTTRYASKHVRGAPKHGIDHTLLCALQLQVCYQGLPAATDLL